LDQKTLIKKAAAKAALAPGNMISGAVALAASAALWNPLPLILWGLGATGWVSFASTAERYHKLILVEEKQSAEAKAVADRTALLQKVQACLADPQVAGWLRRSLMPDYIAVFRRLSDVRDRVAKVLSERTEMDAQTQQGILQQLDYMLSAYLQFVRERIGYLQILVNVRPGGPDVGEGAASMSQMPQTSQGSQPPPLPPLPVAPMPNRFQRAGRGALRPVEDPPGAAPPSVEQRLTEIDAKIKRLKDLAEKEPATARTREWHVGILQKQRDLLLDCQKRDQCVVAQLGAFADVFEVILGRVSASQLSATEVASYMGSVVEQVEETERFVASLRPAVDQLMGGVDADMARWPAST
jgi:hypothetical protein